MNKKQLTLKVSGWTRIHHVHYFSLPLRTTPRHFTALDQTQRLTRVHQRLAEVQRTAAFTPVCIGVHDDDHGHVMSRARRRNKRGEMLKAKNT